MQSALKRWSFEAENRGFDERAEAGKESRSTPPPKDCHRNVSKGCGFECRKDPADTAFSTLRDPFALATESRQIPPGPGVQRGWRAAGTLSAAGAGRAWPRARVRRTPGRARWLLRASSGRGSGVVPVAGLSHPRAGAVTPAPRRDDARDGRGGVARRGSLLQRADSIRCSPRGTASASPALTGRCTKGRGCAACARCGLSMGDAGSRRVPRSVLRRSSSTWPVGCATQTIPRHGVDVVSAASRRRGHQGVRQMRAL